MDYFFIIFRSKQKKNILEGIDKIYRKIDTLYLIRKLNEIDKLKLLLMTPDQIKLFEYLSKPHIGGNLDK